MTQAKVLFVAAEMTPLAKTGGLGDVIGALPKALKLYTESVTVALPFHSVIPRNQLHNLKKIDTVIVQVAGSATPVSVWQATSGQINLLLFKQTDFLSRGAIYDGQSVFNPLTGKLAVKNNVGQGLRYLFFSYAVAAYLENHARRYTIVHVHDFHIAPLIALIHHNPALKHLKTILTIHNLAYTGPLSPVYWQMFEPSLHHLFSTAERRRPTGPRMLSLGIQLADYISTVSPQYAKEILTPEYGNDFELILQERRRKLYSILNGIDIDRFNPAKDPVVYKNFSLHTLERRSENKRFLQRRCHLPLNQKVPIIGFVARLTSQKGINLILNILPELSALPAQFVVCGDGPTHYMKAFQEIAELHPHQWHFHNKFDTIFSQYVYAGADIFLMPSRHEPCGLAQLIAMRYGSVPVVRATGGLKDTVQDNVNGFSFTKYSGSAMLSALQRAIRVYTNQPKRWRTLMHNGMAGDYSWNVSAKIYADLYTNLLKPHRGKRVD